MEYSSNTRHKEIEEDHGPKVDPLTLVHLSKQIDFLLDADKNKSLEKIKRGLENYKKELDDKITLKTPIANEYFKGILYTNLEALLFEAIYIPIKKLRDDKLRQIERWYDDKLKRFNSLDHVSVRTDKYIEEIFLKEELPCDDILIQDEEYEKLQFRKHRTDIEGLEPPRDRLKQFQTKQINPPQIFKKDNKILADLKFNIERFKGRVGSANSSITLQSTFYATKTGQKWFSNSGIGTTNNLQPIQPKKEIKSSYSYIRPEFQFNRLAVEKQILQSKNKELAFKRSQQEISNLVSDFGKNRAAYKEENEIKHSYSTIIKNYGKFLRSDGFKIQRPKLNHEQIKADLQSESIDLEKDKQKVIYSKVMTSQSITEEPKEAKDYKIYTSINRNELKKNILNQQREKINNIRSDTRMTAMTNDKVFAARQLGAKMCHVNEIDTPKNGYMHHYKPLSAFDTTNYAKYTQNGEMPKIKKSRPNTVAQYVSQNFTDYQYDFLYLRKTMEKFKQNELSEIEKTFQKAESCQKIDELKKFFQPIVHPQYPTSFLPRSKSSLLCIPPDLLTKKKKKGKKLKKKKR